MARLRKTHDEDLGFVEDFRCDLGFVFAMVEAEQTGYAEDAMVEMVDIVRQRLETLADRPEPDVRLVFESAVALVMVERMLTVWKQKVRGLVNPIVDDALRFATETIDKLDELGRRGRRPLREMVAGVAIMRTLEQL